jgi:hypothetical protein
MRRAPPNFKVATNGLAVTGHQMGNVIKISSPVLGQTSKASVVMPLNHWKMVIF